MATRRRTANWIQPPGEEKKKQSAGEKGGHGAKEVMVGSADIILLFVTAKCRRGATRRALWVIPLVQCGLSCSHSLSRGSKHRPAQMQTNFLLWVSLN